MQASTGGTRGYYGIGQGIGYTGGAVCPPIFIVSATG